jgi:hypothetical protein
MRHGSRIRLDRYDVVILACASSAGIHAALVPEHLREGVGPGTGFVLSVVALASVVVALTRRPVSGVALGAAAVVLAGLLAAYALATTTGLPVLHPEVEPVDGLALLTKAIEAAGLLAASRLLRRPPVAVPLRQAKGTLT